MARHLTTPAHTAGPSNMPVTPRLALVLLCGCWWAAVGAAAEVKVISYPAATPTSATLRLLPASGQVGRDTPFYSNYRPQVWFSAEKEGVTCAVLLPPPREKVEPGESAKVYLNCLDGFRVFETRRQFTVTQGGRLVAEGSLH
jgi:hypothetical protein